MKSTTNRYRNTVTRNRVENRSRTKGAVTVLKSRRQGKRKGSPPKFNG